VYIPSVLPLEFTLSHPLTTEIRPLPLSYHASTCRKCGEAIPASAPEGGCPSCLVKAAAGLLPTEVWRNNGWHGQAQDGQPVNCIAWPDAHRFCDWLSRQEPGRTYRLPTDAEWEFACRAGTTTPYWWVPDLRHHTNPLRKD